MPTLEEINRIKSQLLEIGHEPSILAEKGETPVDIPLPEEGVPEDISDLFGEDMTFTSGDEAGSGQYDDSELELDLGIEEPPLDEDINFDDGSLADVTRDLEDDLDLGEDLEFDDNFDFETGETPDPEEISPEEQAPEADSGQTALDEDLEPILDLGMDENPVFEESTPASDTPSDTPVEDVSFEDNSLAGEAPDLEDDLEFDDDLGFDSGDSPAVDLDLDSAVSEPFGDEDIDLSIDDTSDETDNAEDIDLGEFEIADEDAEDADIDDFDIDEFDLGDLGQDFGVLEDTEELSFDSPGGKGPGFSAVPEDQREEESLEEEPFEISDSDFKKLTLTLDSLPRNLKLIIEEYIGEKNLAGEKVKKITDALIAGKSPREIASITGKATGQKIKIPAGYERKSGINFEEETKSFKYQFWHTIFPLIRILFAGTILIGAVVFIGYKFVYKPVHALVLYNKGYKELEIKQYTKANDYFDRAAKEKIFKKQYYRYADGFKADSQWDYAEDKYEELLKNFPFDKKGTLDYATMEFKDLYNYEKASDILDKFIAKNKVDYDALLLYGDVNLEWGSQEKDRYEEARRAYARIINNYGTKDEVLFRMMKYFIRTDDPKEVEALKLRFQADDELKVDPDVYAELAKYQIDRNDLGDVKDILFRAKNVDQTVPEIHYQLARYFRKIGDVTEEDKALAQALHFFKEKSPLSMSRREELIDVYRRRGERFYAKKEYLKAQESYTNGINLLEESRKISVVSMYRKEYGKMFADLGDIYYFVSGNLDTALDMYQRAEKEYYHHTDVYYKKGYIYYSKEAYQKALLNFYNAAGTFSTNTNLLYSTANTLYLNNDLFMAQGYYNHLLDILENKLSAERPLQLEFRKDQRKLLQDLVYATNNLGVVMYGLYERTGNSDNFTKALVLFTESNDYYDALTRNPETMTRANSINLAFLNQKKMLYPVKGYSLQIYKDIQKDEKFINFD